MEHQMGIREVSAPVRRHTRGEPAVYDTGERISDCVRRLLPAVSYKAPADARFAAVTQLSTGANSHYNGLQLTGRSASDTVCWRGRIILEPLPGHVSNGGFLPFSAGGIISRCRHAGQTVWQLRLRYPPQLQRQLRVRIAGPRAERRPGKVVNDWQVSARSSITAACRSRFKARLFGERRRHCAGRRSPIRERATGVHCIATIHPGITQPGTIQC